MSDCDCCGCEIVSNYRNQRIKPDGLTFAQWISSDRKFFEIEGNIQDDSGGPVEFTTAGGSFVVDSFQSETHAYGGPLTLKGVWGTKHFLDVGGTVGQIFGGSVQYVAFGQQASIFPTFVTPTIGEIAPAVLPFPDLYSTEEQIDAARDEEVQMSFMTLGYADKSLRVSLIGSNAQPNARLNGRIEIDAWHDLDDDDEPWIITAAGYQRAKNGYGPAPNLLSTADLNRSAAGSQTPTFFLPAAENPGSFWPRAPYFAAPVIVRGEKVTLYRNGEVVLEGIRPSEAATLAATAEDGSYLIVSEVDESTNRPWTGSGIDTRRRWPRPFKQLASFVVDRQGPVVGATPPQDFWIDQREFATGGRVVFTFSDGSVLLEHGNVAIASTKPLTKGLYAAGLDSDGGSIVRPYVDYGTGGFGSNNPVVWKTQPGNVGIFSLPVGVHSVVPSGDLTGPPFKDLAGNDSTYYPTFTVQIHAVPQNNRRGARPRLEDVGLQTREYWRPRFEHEQVRTVRLIWDRKVKSDTVDASQITLTRNGVAVAGCTIEQQSETIWTITLPNVTQDSKSFWLLTYDPAGDVETDDIVTEVYGSPADFPATTASKYKTVYVDSSTGDRYSKSPTGYVVIESNVPLDSASVPYDPEPCVLATRTAWLMSSFDGWLEPEDVVSRQVLVGTMASIAEALDEPPVDNGEVTLSTEGNAASISNLGFHAKSVVADGFTATVPLPTDPPDDCSYWGLKTTIDPCPPREVTECACPRAEQRHASVIRSDDDILSLTLSLVLRSSAGEEIVVPDVGDPSQDFPRWGANELEKSFNGSDLAQNVWALELPEQSPVTTTNLLGSFTSTVLGGTVFLEAFRFVTEYAGRKTAYLNELEFEVRCQYVRKLEVVPTPAGIPSYGENPVDQYGISRVFDRFALSKDQEETLADGGVVYARYFLTDTNAYWWKLQATPAEE
jgi:hypothetical protein